MNKKQITYLLYLNTISFFSFFTASFYYQNDVYDILQYLKLGATFEKVTNNIFSITIQTSLMSKTIINQPLLMTIIVIIYNIIIIVGMLIFNKFKSRRTM
jgi:hypothetical protein